MVRDVTLNQRARVYAAQLRPGIKLLEATDGKVFADFRTQLCHALVRRGLRLEPVSGGWVVMPLAVAREKEPHPLIRCIDCGLSIMDSACDHGINRVVVVGWAA
jgi:hypothetical protein